MATAKKPFSTTDIFPSVAVRAYKVTCDNFANAATSLPQHFLIIIKSRKQILNPTAACKKWNKSSITIAASSVCKHEILPDRLKIQLRTVWCSINFYFCSKQTMNVSFHWTFAWICVDFSCRTAFLSYHVMSAKTRVLKCCCLLFDWTEFWESSALLNWLMMTLERRHDLITVLKPYFLPKRLHSTKSYFIKAIDHTFYGFTSVVTHLECWKNTRKACKSLAFGSWFTSFSRVLPTSCVGYHAGKPIESVVYCLNNLLKAIKSSFCAQKQIVFGTYFSLLLYCSRRHSQARLNN